jgi:hypothetical protein
VTLFDAASFGRQRWTEINLTATPDDTFVNVGDTVHVALTALWAHDENGDGQLNDPVPSATVTFTDSFGNATTCDVSNGTGSCDLVMTSAYASGFAVSVASSSTGVTREAGGQVVSISPVWTAINVTGCAMDDSFVDKNHTVTMTCNATYLHDGSNVSSATLGFGSGVPNACALEQGAVTNGTLTAKVRCDLVYGGLDVPLLVTTADRNVTELARPLTDLNATWTQVVIAYSTDTPQEVLAPDAPVTFTANISFAHDGSPVSDGAIVVQSETPGDTDQFVCVTPGPGDSGVQGQCSVEVTKHLGKFTFDVTGFSTKIVDGKFAPDIDSMQQEPPNVTYRWTSIGFLNFTCTSGGNVSSCDGQDFPVASPVRVTVTAVAADTNEPLANATIKIAGNTVTTGPDGSASMNFTRFSQGQVTITARGVSATIEGQDVTWTIPRTETLYFVNG